MPERKTTTRKKNRKEKTQETKPEETSVVAETSKKNEDKVTQAESPAPQKSKAKKLPGFSKAKNQDGIWVKLVGLPSAMMGVARMTEGQTKLVKYHQLETAVSSYPKGTWAAQVDGSYKTL